MTKRFIVDINHFDTDKVGKSIVDTIKKTFDKEDRFKLYVGGWSDDPNEMINICDKGSNDLSYNGLIDHISKLHLVYQKCKEDDN